LEKSTTTIYVPKLQCQNTKEKYNSVVGSLEHIVDKSGVQVKEYAFMTPAK
jgi:hypothetical protein